jgi:hypothetical protein
MAAVVPARSVIDAARRRADDARKLAADTRKAVEAFHRAFARSLAIYKDAEAATRRLQERLPQSRDTATRATTHLSPAASPQ